MKALIATSLLFTAVACNDTPKSAVTPPDVTATNIEKHNEPTATRSTDAEITRKLREQMSSVDLLKASVQDVQILTLNGVVKLEGTVPSKSASSTLLSLANDIPGVTKVENKLSVGEN